MKQKATNTNPTTATNTTTAPPTTTTGPNQQSSTSLPSDGHTPHLHHQNQCFYLFPNIPWNPT